MEIDQQAKYLLLDKWCKKHNKPATEDLAGYDVCKDCIAEVKKAGIDLVIYASKSVQEATDNLRKAIQGSNKKLDSVPPKIEIPKQQKRRYKFKESKTFRQKWRNK